MLAFSGDVNRRLARRKVLNSKDKEARPVLKCSKARMRQSMAIEDRVVSNKMVAPGGCPPPSRWHKDY